MTFNSVVLEKINDTHTKLVFEFGGKALFSVVSDREVSNSLNELNHIFNRLLKEIAHKELVKEKELGQ